MSLACRKCGKFHLYNTPCPMANTEDHMANIPDMANNTAESMANTSPDMANTYQYRNAEKRREYMRNYMRRRRTGKMI